MAKRRTVLLVEDNLAEIELTREAFAELPTSHDLRVVRDGDEALAFLEGRAPHEDAPKVDLVLLDLNLPRVGGLEVLEQLKGDGRNRRVAVLVFSTSSNVHDVRAALDREANAYLTKPLDYEGLVQLIRDVDAFWLQRATLLRNDD